MYFTLYTLILNINKTKTPKPSLQCPPLLILVIRLVNFPLEDFAMATEVAHSKAGTLVIMFPLPVR